MGCNGVTGELPYPQAPALDRTRCASSRIEAMLPNGSLWWITHVPSLRHMPSGHWPNAGRMSKRFFVRVLTTPNDFTVSVDAKDEGDAFDQVGDYASRVCPGHFKMEITTEPTPKEAATK